MPDEQCPICHSKFGATGANGSDDPKWMDDPIKTPRGLAGSQYCGIQHMKHYHFIQLQQYYTYLRTQVSLTPKTFSIIDDTKDINHYHIEELRQTVEDILQVVGKTIVDYFKSDKYGDTLTSSQTDWTDVDRGRSGYSGKPLLPLGVSVKAIHIEELRRGLQTMETYLMLYSSSHAFSGVMISEGLSKGPYAGVTGATGPAHDPRLYFDDYNFLLQGHTVNNMRECLILQNGTLHLFSTDGNVPNSFVPYYSWTVPSKLDYRDWHGTIGWGPTEEDIEVKFNPELPWSEDAGGFGNYTEGINSIAVDIDDPSDDYVMYTCELFYARDGEQHWREFNYRGAPNYVARYKSPKKRILDNSSAGVGGQTYSVTAVGIALPLFEHCETILVGTSIWSRVENFNSSTSTSHHYMLDYATGQITFGNGTRGAIPTRGTQISIQLSLLGGGTWVFDTILHTLGDLFYYGIQAHRGQYWYEVVNNAFCAARGVIKTINSEFRGVHTQFWQSPNSWPSTDHFLMSEDWQYYGPVDSDTWLRIKGTSILETQGSWNGLLDAGLLVNDLSGNPIPFIHNDSPNFDVQFNYRDGQPEQLNAGVGASVYWYEVGTGAGPGDDSGFISQMTAGIHYGDLQWDSGLNKWVLSTDDAFSIMQFTTGNDSGLRGYITRIGDQTRTYMPDYSEGDWDYPEWKLGETGGGGNPTDGFWKVYTAGSRPGVWYFAYYEKVWDTGKSWIKWGSGYTAYNRSIFYDRHEHGVTTNLSLTVPLKIEGVNGGWETYGYTWGDIPLKLEITHLESRENILG